MYRQSRHQTRGPLATAAAGARRQSRAAVAVAALVASNRKSRA